MFRQCYIGSIISKVNVSFTTPTTTTIRQFSTSFITQASKIEKLKAEKIKMKNLDRRWNIGQQKLSDDPVLGKPDNPFFTRLNQILQEPDTFSNGYTKNEIDTLLFGAEQSRLSRLSRSGKDIYARSQIFEDESLKREAVNRILAMSNSNNSNRISLAINLAMKEFQRFEGDTGSSEVQAAVWSVRIHTLAQRYKKNKHDFRCQRDLRQMVQKRQRILRYLKRSNPERYFWAIQKLGLEDHTIEAEFNMGRAYLQHHNFFGDGKILVRESKKKRDITEKQIKRNKRVEEGLL